MAPETVTPRPVLDRGIGRPSTPLWKQLFDAVDRRVEPTVNERGRSRRHAGSARATGRKEVEQRSNDPGAPRTSSTY
jgi:hypothetical protein